MKLYNFNQGRLGNSIFRFFANVVIIKIYSDVNIKSQIINHKSDYDCVMTDDWFCALSQAVFDIDNNEKYEQNPYDDINKNKYLTKYTNIDSNTKIYFCGYFQLDKIYVKFKKDIIDYILNNQIILKTDRHENYNAIDLLNIKHNKKYNIVIHLRLEDFILISHVINPIYLKNLLTNLKIENNEEIFCFVVNKPKTELEHKYIKYFTNKFDNIVIESNDVLVDFAIMRDAKILVCSHSTLSWASVILSSTIETLYMPMNGHTLQNLHTNTIMYDCQTCSESDLKNILENNV